MALITRVEVSSPSLRFYARALRATLNLLRAQGSGGSQALNDAIRWSRKQQLALREQSTYDWEIFEKLVYARVLLWQYKAQPEAEKKSRLEEFLDFIQKQITILEKLGWNGTLVEVYAVVAVILHNLDRTQQAYTALEKSLDLAEPEGYIRLYVDEGESMHTLLREWLTTAEDGTIKIFVQHLISQFVLHPNLTTTAPGQVSSEGELIEPLSPREIEVLTLIADGKTNKEIAQQLIVSPGTIKAHTSSIYRKLDVANRTEAVARARQLSILS